MPKNHSKILCIKPGTKFMGTAVLDDLDLVYWRNKKIRESTVTARQARKKLRDILTELIDFWNPGVIAVEDVYYYHSKQSRLLQILLEEIKTIGKERRLKVCYLHPLSVRRLICRDIAPNKMNTARLVATEYYPWLYEDYKKEFNKKWYEIKTGLRVFDAIAIGIFCHHKLNAKKHAKK